MKTKLLFTFLLLLSLQFITAQSIGFLGDYSGWGDDTDLSTSDNISYTISSYYFPAGGLKFRLDNAWGTSWGGDTFPSGTTTSNNIPVTAGFFDVLFNITTGDYTFTSATGTDQNVSIIGDFNGWAADFVLTTSDNIIYSATNVALTVGGLKFRRNASWAANYGGTTLTGTGAANSGDNIPIPSNTNYDISFNIDTLSYTIVESALGLDDNTKNVNIFYTKNTLKIKGYNGIASIRTYDVFGRLLQNIEKAQIQNNFARNIILPKNQLSFIVIEGENFRKTLKVIAY
jgi:starch-binding outer membrane protein SusE/F